MAHGVATFGFATAEGLELEVGAFNGHEPDQDRWGIETPSLNSIAARIGVNPHEDWSLQVSFAQLDSPEQLHQGLGYIFDVPVDAPLRMGVGVSGSFTWLPPELHDTYGSSPGAVTAFLRMKLGR